MSIIAAIFGWTKLPQWALELGVIAALAIGFALYHHHVLDQGIKAQQAADQRASAKVEAQAAIATQAAQDAANRAEESYREEIASNAAAAVSAPLPVIRLCINTDVGSPGVPQTSTAYTGNAGASTASPRVQQMPAGNTGLRQNAGPDISELLGLLARRADDGSAVTREFQARDATNPR